MTERISGFNPLSRRTFRCFVLTTACLIGIGLPGCAPKGSRSSNPENNQALRQVLSTPLPSIGGPQRRLRDFEGKIVMLHFFSSWCAQCAIEAPTLRNVYNSFRDSNFVVVGVAVDDDPFQAQAFASKFSFQFPVLLDITGELKQFFSIKELPATLFLDRNGVPIHFKDPASGKTTALIEGPRVWDSTGPVEMIAKLVEGL